jgi:hypothetical protein
MIVFGAAMLVAVTAAPASAQPAGGGFWSGGPGMMMGPGTMMGPGMMRGWGRGDQRNFCNPGAAGFSEWQYERIQRAVQLNDAQKKALDEVRAASAKAAEKIAASCPAQFPASASARLTVMEKRMESMLEAVRTVKPAFEAFYATLDDKQKAALDNVETRRGWRGWR